MSESKQEKYQKFEDESSDADCISIKIKSLDGNVKNVKAILKHTIMQFKESYFKSELDNNKIVKLIYRGRLLKDDELIENINFPKDTFIHVSVQNNPNPPKPSNQVAVQIPASQSNQDQNNNGQNNQEQEVSQNNNNNNNNNQHQIVLPDDLERQLQSALNQQEMQELRQIITGQNNQAAGNNNNDNNNINQVEQQVQPQAQQDLVTSQRSSKLEFIIGFFIGFLFGFIGLLFIMFCSVSQNQKYGAMIGFTTAIMYQVLFMSGGRNSTKESQEQIAQSQTKYADDSLTNGNEFISNFFMSPVVMMAFNYFFGI